MDRRDFLKLTGSAVAAGAIGGHGEHAAAQPAAQPSAAPFAAPPIETVRIGYVGIGGQARKSVV